MRSETLEYLALLELRDPMNYHMQKNPGSWKTSPSRLSCNGRVPGVISHGYHLYSAHPCQAAKGRESPHASQKTQSERRLKLHKGFFIVNAARMWNFLPQLVSAGSKEINKKIVNAIYSAGSI